MTKVKSYLLPVGILLVVAFFVGCGFFDVMNGTDTENTNTTDTTSDGSPSNTSLLPPDEEIVQLESGIAFEGYIESTGN